MIKATIVHHFEKTDENGNKYYVDEAGNRVEKEEEKYRYLNKEYVDYVDSLTGENLARQREEGLAKNRLLLKALEEKRKPFLLKALGNLQMPKERKPLWVSAKTCASAQDDVPTVYWAERELCVLSGDNGVGKSLMALEVARTLTMQNSECRIQNDLPTEPQAGPIPEGEGAKSIINLQLTMNSVVDGEGCERLGEDIAHPLPLTTSCQGTPPLQGESLTVGKGEGSAGFDYAQPDYSKRVLYVDWELSEEDFVRRFGTVVPENFFWAGFNTNGEMPDSVRDKTEWLLQNLATTVRETEANVLIVDQPDRLHLSPQKWADFLLKIKAMMREMDLSVMLVLSNKSRHTSKPCGLNNMPKGTIVLPCADSVVMMCHNQRRTNERYLKVLKNRNRPAAINMEMVDIVELEEFEGCYKVHPWGRQPESDMLPPNAAERKNLRIMEAERLWDEGLSCFEIGEQMVLAESTVKTWLRPLLGGGYAPSMTAPNNSFNKDGHNTTSPLRGTPPTLGGENTPSPSAYALGTPPLQGESLNFVQQNGENLLQPQGFERRQVRVSMP